MNSVSPAAFAPFRKERRRWWIVWTLFISTTINYLNRQTLSVLAPLISKQFHLSHTELSSIFGDFQFTYAATWLVGGVFLDIVGTRLGLSLAVIWWSLVSMVTSFANSAFSFGALRSLLGMGEGLNWPGASKAVAEFFPPEERSVAVAIFDSGSSVGGAIAAVCIPSIAMRFGWRFAFVFSGALGFLWLALWLALYPPRPRWRKGGGTSSLFGRWPAKRAGSAETARHLGGDHRACAHGSYLVVLCVLVATILK
jgi:MFS transporter, ACS family, hexuronate transporter